MAVLGLVFWGGWYWGNADQARLQAEANQILLESSDEIIMLKRQLDQALRAKDALLAREVSDEMAARLGTESLSRTIRSLMASGVAPEQIEQALQSVTEPVNCKQTGSYRMAVATDLSSGAESSLALFDGGLRLHLDGEMQARGTRNDPGLIQNCRLRCGWPIWAARKSCQTCCRWKCLLRLIACWCSWS